MSQQRLRDEPGPLGVVGTVSFDIERFVASRYFAPELLSQMRVRRTDHIGREVGLMLDGVVAKWTEERILHVPANWWEHFKQRWFPKWALVRWPVLTTAHDAAVILPKVPIGDMSLQAVEFAVWRQGSG